MKTSSFTAAGLGVIGLSEDALAAKKPFSRAPGGARLRLGLAAYSMRNYFGYMKGKAVSKVPKDQQITMKDFVDFCAKHDCGGAELTSYFFPGNVGAEYYAGLRGYAHQRGGGDLRHCRRK